MGKVRNIVSDTLGFTNHKGERQALGNSIAASNRANEIAAESLAFQKEQYSKWEKTFGPLRTELAEYYQDLNSDDYLSNALQFQRIEHQASQRDTRERLSQRGYDDTSGIVQHALAVGDINNARARAGLRAGADEGIAQQKLGFLNIGLGQQQGFLSNIGSASTRGINAQQNTSTLYRNLYERYNDQNEAFKSKLIDTALLSTGLGS